MLNRMWKGFWYKYRNIVQIIVGSVVASAEVISTKIKAQAV